MSKNIRSGSGYRWSMKDKTAYGIREVSGYTVDNLDTKDLVDAANDYEKTFIMIRRTLELHESSCMDVESERLQCVQAIADALHGRK